MFRVYAGSGIAFLALLSTACSVDERVLASAGGGAGSGGTASVASSGSGGEAGEAGAAGIAPLPLCVFGQTVGSDCDTLVTNPGFTSDTDGWDAEMPSVSMVWSSMDAAGDQASGALSVENSLNGAADGVGIRGAAQCLPTAPGNAYGFAGDILIPEGQGAGLDGGTFEAGAALSIIFYIAGDCTGYSAANFTSDITQDAGQWGHHEGRAVAPDGATSMLVRLVTLKNFQQFTFKALFDNVLVKAE